MLPVKIDSLQWQHPHSLLYVMQQEKVHSFIDVKVIFVCALLLLNA